MAFTKVTAAGISTGNSLTIQELNTVGVITAATVQVGSATTIHTTGIDLGSGNITSHNINSTGIITATGAVITGNLQVEGTTTTLDSLVTEVDKLEVAANNTNVAVAVTQSGTGDILRLYDGSTQAVTVKDGGNVGIAITNPETPLHIKTGQNSIITLEDQDTTVETDSLVGALRFKNLDNTSGGINAYIGGYNEDTTGAMYLSFGTGTSNSTTERLRITSSGSIECKGETDIQNNILRVTDATPRIIMSVPSGGLDSRLYNDGSGNFIIGHGTNSDAPTERLRIASDGAITITSDGGDNDGANITLKHANNNTTDTVSALIFSNNVGEVARIVGRTDGGNNNGGITFHTDNAGTTGERLRITSTGAIGIGSNFTAIETAGGGGITLDAGGGGGQIGVFLKSTGYTGNQTKLWQDSANAVSYLESTERPFIIKAGNATSHYLRMDVAGGERLRVGEAGLNASAAGRMWFSDQQGTGSPGTTGFTAYTHSDKTTTTLDTSFNYIYRLTTTGTSTRTGATYLVWYYQNTLNWYATLISRGGSTSNHPLLRINGNTVEIYTNHASNYNIRYTVERFLHGNSYSRPQSHGPEFMWTRDVDDLYYNPGPWLSEVFRITGSGQVQIDTPGISSGNGSSAKLKIDSTSQYDGIALGNGLSYATISRGSSNCALVFTANANPANLGGGNPNVYEWWSGSSGGGGPNKLMVMTSQGNIGLGVNDPDVPFEVAGERIKVNGLTEISESFILVNNTAYNFDYSVFSEGGYGNSFYIICGYNHYYTTAYGAHRVAFVSTRGTSLGVNFEQDQNHAQAGAWSFSKPNSTTLRITKSAGTYGGSGFGFIKIFGNLQ